MMMNSFSFTFCCFSSTAYLPLGEVVKTRAHQLGCFSAGGWAIAKKSLLNVLLSRWNCSQPGQSFLESAKTIEEWLWKSPLKFSTNGQLVQIFDFLWCFRTFAMFPQRIEDSFQLSSPSSPQVMEAEMSKIFQKSKKSWSRPRIGSFQVDQVDSSFCFGLKDTTTRLPRLPEPSREVACHWCPPCGQPRRSWHDMFWDWIPKGEPLEWVDKKIPTEHGYNLTKKKLQMYQRRIEDFRGKTLWREDNNSSLGLTSQRPLGKLGGE